MKKISIKREQSQAGLSFAEREKFRPQVKNKLLLLLVLLAAVATGAWAQDPAKYKITVAEGTEDAENWTVPAEAAAGSPVTATYNGTKKVKSVKAVKKSAVDPKYATPLTIEAITPGNISVSGLREGFQYSKNGGAKTAVTNDEIVLNAGDKVQFYGNGTSITYYQGTNITGIGDGFTCKVYGNIMSLVDEEGFATATTLSEGYTFAGLFFGFNTLTDASGLLLPATQLAENCYYEMFRGCSSLTTAPELPAETLAASCYYYMFYKCSALTAAPALPAETLAENCYNQMFRDCSSLTTAPELPAETLVSSCYRSMFMNCTALTASPVLPAETLVENCYYQMFSNCRKLATVTCLATSGIGVSNSTYNWLQGAGSLVQGTKTFNAVSSAVWPEGNNGIPTNSIWQRKNINAGIVTPVVGQVIGSDGKNYDANATLPDGVTALAKIAYVGSDNGEAAPYNHGLALALSDANDGSTCQWSTEFANAHGYRPTSSSFTSESGLQYNATHNSDTYPAFKAAITYSPAAPTGCSAWFLASGYQWQKMAGVVGGLTNLGLQGSAYYWTSTEYNPGTSAWRFSTGFGGNWYSDYKNNDSRVRACLAF